MLTDKCQDHRTFRKIDRPVVDRSIVNAYSSIYNKYANIVKVKVVTDQFKNMVNEFRREFEVPTMKHPTGLIKQQWISYYNRNK